jgi:two-component system sensor histidine kinase HydH
MRPQVGPRVDRLLDYREYPILFVDDEVENLRVFELSFRREFQIRTARSGEEALQSLHDHPAALVLSDHRMEGMSGVELLAKVREVDAKTVRILVTAYGDAATLSDAINNGWIYRYVPKPWRPEEMRLTLRNGIEVYALAREREHLLYELEALNRTAKLLNRELELVPLLDLLLETVTRDFGYDGATVFLLDAEGERLQAVRSAPRGNGVAERLTALDVPASTAPVFFEQLREGRTQIVRMSELTSLEGPVRRLATEIAADEILVLPLLGHRGVIGALAVDNRRGGEDLGAADYTLLDGLASQAVIAIENARLVGDLRRSREQVRRADRLGTLGTLAAGLAHEINNPLVAIRTFLTLAPAKRYEDDREFWTDYHDLTLREVDRIHSLVRTMGQLGRGGGDDAARGACDLAGVVEEAIRLLAPEATRGGVEVTFEHGEDVPKVVGVRDHLHQVVLNLLLNAIHACAKPGRTVRPGEPEVPKGQVHLRLRAERREESDGVSIEVADDGYGIRSEDLERIFDPFFTTKGPDQGSGLGLMICHRIVQDHGGRIELESLEGRGSTFRVWLPVGSV